MPSVNQIETLALRTLLRHGETVGGHPSREYIAWHSMKGRCLNPKNGKYKDYGGRGISICKRWMTFENFLLDMGRKPSPRHSIERSDVNGNYQPGNCVWGTPVQQARNTRKNVIVEFRGERHPISEWCEILDLNYNLIRQRIYRDKMTPEEAFTPEIIGPRIVFGEDCNYTKLTNQQAAEIKRRRAAGERRKDLAREFGVSTNQIYNIVTGRQRAAC